LARRLLLRAWGSVLTLLFVTLVVFVLIHLLPGDPFSDEEAAGTKRLTAAEIAELRALYRLDEPLGRQYLLWLGDLLRGDLGRSFQDRRPVSRKIAERLPATLTLNAAAVVLMLVVSIPIGTLAAWRRGVAFDRIAGGATYALYAVPVFWAALLLQLVFAARLGWFPLLGLSSEGAPGLGALARIGDRAAHLVLPAICLAYPGIAYISRFVRSSLLEATSGEFERAGRARGLTGLGLLARHGFRLGAVPLLTLAGFLVRHLVAGSVLVEWTFAIPGLGLLFIEGVLARDVPLVMGLTLVSSAATLAGTFLADSLYEVADPRVRRG
jgi:peptide/nickel transport system permease protein